MTTPIPQFDHPVRNQLSCDALEWYDEKTLERDLTRDEFHMRVLLIIDTASLAAAGEIMEAAIVSRGEIDRLTKERDECKAQYSDALGQISHLDAKSHTLALEVDQWRVDFHELRLEHDALMSAAKLALDFVGFCWRDVTLNEYAEDRRGNVEIALRQAGVQ